MSQQETKSAIAERVPLSNGRLGIMLFVASEIMLFAGLVAAYVVLRFAGNLPFEHRLPAGLSLAGTILIVLSSVLLDASRRVASPKALLAGAVVSALAFIGIEGLDWWHLIGHGVAVNVRSGIVTVVAALHLVHALIGILLMARLFRRSADGGIATFYWHFVTLTWLAIVAVLFLL